MNPPRRRPHWRVLASKKLRYAAFMGGEGAHVVLSKCAKRWRYWLHADGHEALVHRLKVDRERCGPECRGDHNDWELRDV